MIAWSWLALTKVVVSGCRPLTSTVERFVKLLPLTVIVRSGLPAATEVWLRLVIFGATVWPDREKLALKVVPPMMSVPMRSQSGAKPGSNRIQLCRSVAPAGNGVPGGAIGLGAESHRKLAAAGALSESPTLGTKKEWPVGRSTRVLKVTSNSTSSPVAGPLPPDLLLILSGLDTEFGVVKVVLSTREWKRRSPAAESKFSISLSAGELTRVGTSGVLKTG